MSAELQINVTPSETRVAMIEAGLLQEVHIERESRRGIVGNIYKGKVSRVLPGMQAAFVDIGLDKAAFYMPQILFPTPNVSQKMRRSNFRLEISQNWFAKGKILSYKSSKIL